MSSKRRIVVFSGGSAANNLVDVFGKVADDRGSELSYIIPISDNGGSTSELIRMFGGPGIGDVRSRLVRLIPTTASPESTALKALFNHRLSSSPNEARSEWHSIIESTHPLWTSVSSSKRELIRSYLSFCNYEIVKRVRPSSSFNFQSASVGNLFLTGARLFTGSFESACYLLGAITGVPGDVQVVPAINSNFSHHISAGLEDGTVITGQNAISHPSAPTAPVAISTSPSSLNLAALSISTSTSTPNSGVEIAPETVQSPTGQDDPHHLPGSLPSLRHQNIAFAKHATPLLPSRVERIWYINPYGQEIRPAPNPQVLSSLEEAGAVVYSIGSLYTSILPCLILRGVGEAIAGRKGPKVLLLNGSLDRETTARGMKFTASDFVQAIADACAGSKVGRERWREYVSHVLFLSGRGTPVVEREPLEAAGIECVRVYGRRAGGVENEGLLERDEGVDDPGMIYDPMALGQALSSIIGRGMGGSGVSRRNTLGVGGVLP